MVGFVDEDAGAGLGGRVVVDVTGLVGGEGAGARNERPARTTGEIWRGGSREMSAGSLCEH